MKIQHIGESQIIMSNPNSKHDYFAWPTIARLQNGKIAVTASGFRLAHVCPFGKMVISYSEDDGETYTLPAPVIDTPLDDRDAGILAFGEKNVIVTSFNNRRESQRKALENAKSSPEYAVSKLPQYTAAYIETITDEEEERYIGSTFRISHDCGVTFGELKKSPVTSPHGPILKKDGTVLYIGNHFDGISTENILEAHIIHEDGTSEYVSSLPPIYRNGKRLNSHEPHALELDDGTILCHIRVESSDFFFSTYQTESMDGGKTWTEPHQILDHIGGAPSFLIRHSSGVIISVYSYRKQPYGIKAMFSYDNGKTWDIGYDINSCPLYVDLGYPATIEMADGSLLTVFYASLSPDQHPVILQQRWKMIKD